LQSIEASIANAFGSGGPYNNLFIVFSPPILYHSSLAGEKQRIARYMHLQIAVGAMQKGIKMCR
jgi:hypothetical protein